MTRKIFLTIFILSFISLPSFSFFELISSSFNSFSSLEGESIQISRRMGGSSFKKPSTSSKPNNKPITSKKESSSDKKTNSKDTSNIEKKPSFFSQLSSMLPFIFLFGAMTSFFSFLGAGGGILGVIILLLFLGGALYFFKLKK